MSKVASRVPAQISVGLRRAHHQVVRLVHAEGDLAENVLLGILRAVGVDQPAKGGEVANRRRGDDAIIQRHEISRQRAAAGVARAADLVRRMSPRLCR